MEANYGLMGVRYCSSITSTVQRARGATANDANSLTSHQASFYAAISRAC